MTVRPMLTRTPRNASAKDHLLTRGVTLWRCIADDYEQLILLGKYENGTRLPAETEIAAHYGVNRHTVRHALAALAERGLVVARRGAGVFVRHAPTEYPLGRRRSRTRAPRRWISRSRCGVWQGSCYLKFTGRGVPEAAPRRYDLSSCIEY